MCLIEQVITAKLIAYIMLLIEFLDLSLLFIYCCSCVLVDLSFLVESWLTGGMWCR